MSTEETAERVLSLQTERLTLRFPTEADIPDIVANANNRALAENLATMPHPYGVDDARKWVMQAGFGGRRTEFAIFDRRCCDAFVGSAGFGIREDDMLEIGYWIAEPCRERGFATEAARAVIDLAFGRTDADRLNGVCRVTNEASRRVLVRCGFQYNRSGMSPSAALGGWVPVDRYVLDRSTWESLRTWRSPVVSTHSGPVRQKGDDRHKGEVRQKGAA